LPEEGAQRQLEQAQQQLEQGQQQLEEERQRSDRLAARLRQLGEDPNPPVGYT
jgi:type II secretory pathway pseudopilin PulG